MTFTEEKIDFAQQTLLLNSHRVIFWSNQSALILSDLHLGKPAHFRKHGIPLPSTITAQDLIRLARMIDHYRPSQVIIVGDLIHTGLNKEVTLAKQLFEQYPRTNFVLVKGNHDRLPFELLQELGITSIHETLTIDSISFSHLPKADQEYTISGHIHPGVHIQLPNKQHLRLPCFIVMPQQIVLPAFSNLTGLDTSYAPANAIYYALHQNRIFPITP